MEVYGHRSSVVVLPATARTLLLRRFIHCHSILVDDDHPAENLLPYFQEAHDFIQSAASGGQKVLVHCASGISRSVAVGCAHLMLQDKCPLSYEEPLQRVRAHRPVANPNFGFARQLQCFDTCGGGGGDVAKALLHWQELEEKASSSSDAVRQGREQAHELHAQVDRYEETIMGCSAADLTKQQDTLIMKLSLLQNRIDNIWTDQVRESVGDRPTKMVLQSASTKANRLHRRNPYV